MCIPKTSSVDLHNLKCPCCKLNNLTKCTHPRSTCPNQANHPRFQVVFFKTDLQTFSGCGFCKFARRHSFSSDTEAAQRNHGWPGCCRSPKADDLADLETLTTLFDWPAIAAYYGVPLPNSVAEALTKAGQSLVYIPTTTPNSSSSPSELFTRCSPTATATRPATSRVGGHVFSSSPGSPTSPGQSRDTHTHTHRMDTDQSKDRDHLSNHFTGTGRVSPNRRVNALNARAASPTSPSNTHDNPNHSPTSPRSTTSSGSGSSHSSNSLPGSSRKADRSTRDRDRDRSRDPESKMTSIRHSQDNSPKPASGPNVNINKEKHASWSSLSIREKGAATPQKERRSDERTREYERGHDYQYWVGRKPPPQQLRPTPTISKATAPQPLSKNSGPSLPSAQRQELYTKAPQAQTSVPPTASMRKLASAADTTAYQKDPLPSISLTRSTHAQPPSLTAMSAMMASLAVDNAYSTYPSRFPVNNSRFLSSELMVPRPPNPSPPASQTSSNSSRSSAQEGTVISDGAFTDYLSDDSDVELTRQAEERAEKQFNEALIRAEEQEFKDARELLLSMPISTSPDGPSPRSAPTVDEKRYYGVRGHAALPQAPQGYSIAAAGYTRR